MSARLAQMLYALRNQVNVAIRIMAGSKEYDRQPVEQVMKRKKPRPFRVDKAVKAVARDVIGTPPPTRLVPDKKKNSEQKRKPTLSELLQEN